MSLLFLSPRKHRPVQTPLKENKPNNNTLPEDELDLCDQLGKLDFGPAPKLSQLEERVRELEAELSEARSECTKYCEEVRILKGTSDRLSSMPLRELREVLREVEAHASELRSRVVSRALSSGLCVACHERDRSVVLLPCKHLSLCGECSDSVKSKCPMCRERIESKLHVFV